MRVRLVIAEVAKGMRRNTSMVVSIILVTFISLSFVGAGVLLQRQVGKLKGDWYELAEVSVFMCPTDATVPSCASGEATPEQIENIYNVINTDLADVVSSVYFETKDDAFAAFTQRYPEGFHGTQLTVADMQSSFRLQLSDPTAFELVSDVLNGRSGVELVEDQRAIFQPLFMVLNRSAWVAAAIAVVTLTAGALLIATTIRLSAVSRRKETAIMRLVGASNAVVSLPFILEGAIAATLGALVAIGTLWLIVRFFITDWLQQSMDWMAYIGTVDVWQTAPVLLVIAIGLAALSSAITLNRTPKV